MSAPAPRGRGWTIALLALAVALLLGTSLLSLRTTARLADSIDSVSQTQRMQEQIHRLWGVLGDRDSQVLRFMLTGDRQNLEEFRASLLEFEAARDRLVKEVGDDPAHRASLDELRRLHDERIVRSEALIVLKRRALAGDAAAGAELDRQFAVVRGGGNAEAMRAVLEAMSAREAARLAARQAERARTIRQNRTLVLGANALALFAGGVALLAIRRLRRRADEALRASLEADQARKVASERQASLELVAHDLRGHFGNLLFAADLVRDAADPEARSRLAASVRGSAASGMLFLRAVLEQAAGEARGEAVQALDAAAAVRAVAEEFAAAIEGRRLALALRVDAAPRLRGQPAALAHVLRNLLSNAVKYAPAGSSIEIEAEALADRGRVRVLDRGPGVPEAERPMLFQRYLPLSAPPQSGQPSAGLGLALARQHARAQGGELRYEDRPGGGACFVLDWPLG